MSSEILSVLEYMEKEKGIGRADMIAAIVNAIKAAAQKGVNSGQELKVDLFKAGDYVDVSGTSKGKGFAGVMKRHGFSGGRATHGSMFHRAPGSIGASADPSRVFKGKKLPGHMGSERVTIQNMMVWAVRPEQNLILVKGAVPGGRNGIVLIKRAIKVGSLS